MAEGAWAHVPAPLPPVWRPDPILLREAEAALSEWNARKSRADDGERLERVAEEVATSCRIEGIEVNTGDWILADDDGLMVVPRPQAAEMANRAMDCLERENRIREEIRSQNATLAQVLELLRWEKK